MIRHAWFDIQYSLLFLATIGEKLPYDKSPRAA